ncbi:MAG: toxin-antitoxin system YwqK family antitoxin [Chlorobi bacterium]|nr:toxin-antitoxin system YwqK family antitoxin [Chlorobiota bacterium]
MIKRNNIFLPFVLLIFIFNSIESFAQQDTVKINPNGYNRFYYDNGTLASEGTMRDGKPDGYWKNYYENGKLKSEGNRKNYLLDSLWRFYDEEGKLVLEINYKQGKKNGFRITYQGDEVTKENFVNDVKQGPTYILYPNGKVKMKIPFVNGLENGVAREYDQNGNVIQLITYKKGYIAGRERINRYDADNLPDGKWKWFYDDESLRMEGSFKHGLKNGYFKEYDQEGNLISVTKWVDGEKEEQAEELVKLDVRTDYYPDGTPKVVGTYDKNGIPEGVRREYNKEGKVEKAYIFRHGKIIAEGIFTDAGEKEGFWNEYYPDGKLKAAGRYDKDDRDGLWKFYYPSGQLEEVGKYLNGKPDSTWRWYYSTGKLLREEHFYKGLADGMMTEYDPDGKVRAQGEYIEGKKEDFWFYIEGDTREEGNYVEGRRNGLWKSFYDSGQISFQGKFVDGLPNGKHTWYWENGKVKQEGNYVMGRKTGEWKKYDKNGMIIIVISYKNGKEIKYDGIEADLDE